MASEEQVVSKLLREYKNSFVIKFYDNQNININRLLIPINKDIGIERSGYFEDVLSILESIENQNIQNGQPVNLHFGVPSEFILSIKSLLIYLFQPFNPEENFVIKADTWLIAVSLAYYLDSKFMLKFLYNFLDVQDVNYKYSIIQEYERIKSESLRNLQQLKRQDPNIKFFLEDVRQEVQYSIDNDQRFNKDFYKPREKLTYAYNKTVEQIRREAEQKQ